jgi:uncharacterized protein YxeA
MKKILFSIALLILYSQVSASDCVNTKKYAEARKEVYLKAREVHASYKECRDSAQASVYWMAIAACTEEGLGKDIGGGCAHLVSNGSYPMASIDKSHCEIFKVSKEIEKQYRTEFMGKINVEKCKTYLISKDEAVAAAQKILKPENKEKYTRITSTKWKEHVKSWMIVFEHPNENIEDGYWVMIDGKGEFVDMGKVYTNH